MKKRMFALAVLAIIAALLCGCGAAANSAEPKETELVIATDLHYLSPALTDHGAFFERLITNADGKAVEYCDEIVDAFVEQVIAQKPDGLVISGDLTFNGEKQSHEALAEKLQRVRAADIPVFVMPGNHDLGNFMAASFQGNGYTLTESISAQQFAEIYRDFGYDAAYARDENSLSYIAKLSPKLALLVVDVNGSKTPGSVREDTLLWIEQQLAAAEKEGVRVLSVSHQNLLQHSPLFSKGYVMYRNDMLLNLLERYNVICHFSGHMHTQHIAQSENGMTEIVTSSMLVPPLQYGVLHLEGTSGEYHTEPVTVPAEIGEHSQNFFWDTSFRQALAVLESETDVDNMAAYFADINSAYFCGRMDSVEYDTDELTKWGERDSFLSGYLQSMSTDAGVNHTVCSFELK